MLGLTVFLLLARGSREAIRFLFPVPAVLMAWLLLTMPRDSHLPPTYDTPWLYFHVLTGKLFFTLLVLATGVAIYEYLARVRARGAGHGACGHPGSGEPGRRARVPAGASRSQAGRSGTEQPDDPRWTHLR